MSYDEIMRNAPNVNFWSWDMFNIVIFGGWTLLWVLVALIVFSFLFFGFAISVLNIKDNNKFRKVVKVGIPFIILMSLFITSIYSRPMMIDIQVSEWEDNYVQSYIDELDIIDVKTLNKIDIKNDETACVKWVVKEKMQDECVDIRFKEGVTKPYLTYQVNDENFVIQGKGSYGKGDKYNHVLILPVDYQLD